MEKFRILDSNCEFFSQSFPTFGGVFQRERRMFSEIWGGLSGWGYPEGGVCYKSWGRA